MTSVPGGIDDPSLDKYAVLRQLLLYPFTHQDLVVRGEREFLFRNDSSDIRLIMIVGGVALLAIIYFRFWKHSPLGARYWLMAVLPLVIGSLRGLYQYDWVVYELGARGWSNPASPWLGTDEGICTLHFGLFLSEALCLVVLALYALRFLMKRVPEVGE